LDLHLFETFTEQVELWNNHHSSCRTSTHALKLSAFPVLSFKKFGSFVILSGKTTFSLAQFAKYRVN